MLPLAKYYSTWLNAKGTKRETMQPTSLKWAIKTEFSKQYCCHKENIAIQQVKYLSYSFTKWKCLMTYSSQMLESEISPC